MDMEPLRGSPMIIVLNNLRIWNRLRGSGFNNISNGFKIIHFISILMQKYIILEIKFYFMKNILVETSTVSHPKNENN